MNYISIAKRKQVMNNNNIDPINDIMERISSVESGGDYQALGPEVKSGQYAGERALGRWQTMPGNVKDWSKEALGYSITPEEYLSSPELQNKIVKHQIQKNYTKYGNADDVASVWFTGRPVSKAQGAKDVTGTDVNEYVKRFNSAAPTSAPTGQKRIYTSIARRMMV